ncbi:MAG: protein-L-isoaspartate O-methyltransferase [Novosphingobium sp.]|nr:protein-L-isoaspartate O-methyltransferase [Novosphingobium sp.]
MTTTEERPAATFSAARRAMIDSQLRTSGVNEPWVLSAMASVAREDYVPEAMKSAAYIDRAIPLGDGRSLAAPLVHGKMLEEARPVDADNALLVGDADGYFAALLRPLVGSLDVLSPAQAGGSDKQGPYSLVVIDGAIETLPDSLAARLADGGRLVCGLVERGVTRLATGRRASGAVALLPVADIGIPVLPEFAAARRWSF